MACDLSKEGKDIHILGNEYNNLRIKAQQQTIARHDQFTGLVTAGKPEAENELEICGELERDWSKYGEYM